LAYLSSLFPSANLTDFFNPSSQAYAGRAGIHKFYRTLEDTSEF
jgi:hypothetical protein